ncbi:LysR family transcriptional regulator [Eggerthella timonensis]|uniref:LysR family transcriptional regulator n=1 Tax=Eggerthella timonensis TaxID=1871008 RepID=UPI000C777595|nr:LysR family transcriptional regulator [Eggerthella timonensis]
MDSRQLAYFCAVVRLGSFTKAAEECRISQSAISQQIRALETNLGCELLERRGRRFSPTQAGALLARKGATVLAQLSEIEAEAYDVAHGKPRRLTVGYLNRYDGWEVAGAVAAFARRHPGCEVAAVAGSHDQLYRDALEGKVDLVFNDRRRSLSPDWENVHLETCYRYAEVSEASAHARDDHATCGALCDLPCIIVCERSRFETEASWWRDVMNFDGELIRASSTDKGRMMVAGNRGWLPTESREKSEAAGSIIRRIPLHDANGHSASEYYAFWPKARGNALVAEFAEILRELFDWQPSTIIAREKTMSIIRTKFVPPGDPAP